MSRKPTLETAKLYRVEGRVQGVGFRFFTERVARELGLKGNVRNRADGSVEVYAIGDEAMLEQLRAQLTAGPPGARVSRVSEQPVAVRSLKNFSIEGSG